MTPRVSVVLLTFNHERYIAAAIDSVLMQQGEFAIELIITEDRSTDGTWEFIEDYRARYPDRIRAIRSDRNLNTNEVTARALRSASGEYVAFLDGDDYWTSPDKLARQVAYLDADPFCSMCCHDAGIVDGAGQQVSPSFRDTHPAPSIGSHADLVAFNYIAGPTSLIRHSALRDLPDWFDTVEFGDWALYLAAARHGHIGYIPESMADYRVHHGGYWSGMSSADRLARLITFQDCIAEHGPAAWRQAFRAERDRRLRDLGATSAAEAMDAPMELDLRNLAFDKRFSVNRRRHAQLAVCWGELRLGVLSLTADQVVMDGQAVARQIAASPLGWQGLAVLFERTVYPALTYTQDSDGFNAWWRGVELAKSLPPGGPDRVAALHEKADWAILLQETIASSGFAIRVVLPFLKRGRGLGQVSQIAVDISKSLPVILSSMPHLRIALYLGPYHLKDCDLPCRAGMLRPRDIHAACLELGYELAEAAFLLGVVGHDADDLRTLRERIGIAP